VSFVTALGKVAYIACELRLVTDPVKRAEYVILNQRIPGPTLPVTYHPGW
jgi:hypothetical protein